MRGLLAVTAAVRAAASRRPIVAAAAATTVVVASAFAPSNSRVCAISRGAFAFLPRAALCSAAAPTSQFQSQVSFENAGVHVAAFMIPKPEGSPLGEDAFAICSKRTAFAVADGVGGWAEEGVDAGLYSRALMSGCKAALDGSPTVSLAQALDAALQPAKLIRGSSTAVLADIQGRVLSVLNVGDSGFIVLRRQGRANSKAPPSFFPVMRSYEQQYSFNFPFQLGTGSDLVAADAQLYTCVPSLSHFCAHFYLIPHWRLRAQPAPPGRRHSFVRQRRCLGQRVRRRNQRRLRIGGKHWAVGRRACCRNSQLGGQVRVVQRARQVERVAVLRALQSHQVSSCSCSSCRR